MDCRIDDLVEHLAQASRRYESKIVAYIRLALNGELMDEEADQLAAIYIEAEQDRWLNFFINEWDYILGKKLGLLKPALIEDYKNQQSWLKEHLQEILLDREYRKEVQRLLQEQNFYTGPIDGVLGKRSVEAVQQFQQKHELIDDGVPGPQTYAALKSG